MIDQIVLDNLFLLGENPAPKSGADPVVSYAREMKRLAVDWGARVPEL